MSICHNVATSIYNLKKSWHEADLDGSWVVGAIGSPKERTGDGNDVLLRNPQVSRSYKRCRNVQATVTTVMFYFLIRSCDYNMRVEGLLPANVCLVTLLSSEQCSQCERFRLQHVQIVNRTSRLKSKLDMR